MFKTNAQFVSDVINSVQSLTKDDHISRRFVLSRGRTKSTTYISQKLLDKTLYRESNLFTPIECLELKSDEIVKCEIIQFRRCKSLMKSKLPIPEPIFSRYGPAILRVVSLDDGTELEYSNSFNITNDSKRQFGSFVKKYYIYNGYLYIPDLEVEAIKLEILTLDVKKAMDMCGCCDADKCKTVWDYPFICPDKLYEPIVQETILEIANIYKKIPKDENPNLDNHQKTQLV